MSILKRNTVVNVTLTTEVYELKAVSINAKGEDPAYAIMRKAIKRRKAHLSEVKAYTCGVYIKGLQKLLAAPKKFMGADINQIGREIGLDSNRRGIVYLSESESKLELPIPKAVARGNDHFNPGSNRMFSFNRASDAKVNFYENYQNWDGLKATARLMSPVSDNALFYYKYKLMGTLD